MEEAEVTPEMVRAGCLVIVEWLDSSGPFLEPLAEQVYLAMTAAKNA